MMETMLSNTLSNKHYLSKMETTLVETPTFGWNLEGYDNDNQCLILSRLNEDCMGMDRIQVSDTANGVVMIRNGNVDWYESWHNFWTEFFSNE